MVNKDFMRAIYRDCYTATLLRNARQLEATLKMAGPENLPWDDIEQACRALQRVMARRPRERKAA